MTPAAGGGGGGNLSSNGPAFFSSVAVNGVAGTNTLTGTNLVFSVSGTTNVYVSGNTGYTNTVYGPAGTNTFIVATNGYFAWFSNSTPIFTFTPGTIGITNNANVDIQGTVNMVGAVTARNTFASIGAAAMYGGMNMESTSITGVSTLTVNGNASVANVTTLGTHTPVAVSVGGSPFTFANLTPVNEECYVSGTAAYSLTKNGVAIYSSLTTDSYLMLQTNCVLVLTYSSTAPTLYTNAW